MDEKAQAKSVDLAASYSLLISPKSSFCTSYAKTQKTENFSDELAAYSCGTLLEAGADTTASALYAFVLAMVVWPDIQAKVRAEVDQVAGSDRLPTIDDFEKLPYVLSCVKETLRWMPVFVMGIPHLSTQEDIYQGHRIPAGSVVFNNVW
jgi:cytochrome P450